MTSLFYVTCTVSDTMMDEYVCNYMAVTSSKHCQQSGMYKCFSKLKKKKLGGGTDDDCLYVCAGVHVYLINSGPK